MFRQKPQVLRKEMRETMTTISIEQIKQLNVAKGFHFFSPDTMRFFHSRTAQSAIVVNHIAYFVTSEQHDNEPRRYTIRKANLETGDVSTVGEFQQYATHKQAQNILDKMTGKTPMTVNELWVKACEYDKIDPLSNFVAFSTNNPYVQTYNETIGCMLKEMKPQ